MRVRSILALCALALAPSLAAQAARDARPGLAVFPFHNSGSYGQDKENFDALEKGIAGMMISELAANPQARIIERETLQRLLDEQNLGASGRVDAPTAARIGKLVGARYVITGDFIDFYGDFRLDVRLINVETSEITKVVKEQMRRDHLFDLIKSAAQRLMKEASLPSLPRPVQEERMSRQVPTEALTYYSRALLYQDRGQRDKAIEMYERAIAVFPEYSEANEGLRRLRSS